jgi:hypothetical protein
MLIRELFESVVTRDIPPVVYFHEQRPEHLKAEVEGYIITGGYPDGHPRARYCKTGIHEQYVRLLRQIRVELNKKGGPALPASWISGFYGSGKSSFAKLLGLALDGAALSDGKPLSAALLARDDSPRAKELVEAWTALVTGLQAMAVVFDIGAVARDNEHIHLAALRQLQSRLGYCKRSSNVASAELALERDGQWDAFLAAALSATKRPWDQAKNDAMVEEHFSHAMHILDPAAYRDPMSWVDSHAGGTPHGGRTSVEEVVESIADMRERRAPGKTLFFVIDEVSQYVYQDEKRMLSLQSFVASLGQRLKGNVWLLATGQQKLEDSSEANNIGKLKDRFPPSLRVHLDVANIRDVVHKRLLKKTPSKEQGLRDLFQQHRSDLKLYAYGCESITEEDFVEIYPLLPGHVELLLQITSRLRTRSSRAQGDDHGVRGLLQLLGELFRERKLAERPVGDLVTIEDIFEVQQSALDPDVQTTLARIFGNPEIAANNLALRVAKAVALLELIQEETPTTPELVAKCLHSRLGEGNQLAAVEAALERLRALTLLSYSEKTGFKIQSSAGQEWAREREDYGVTPEDISSLVQEKFSKELLGTPDRPRLRGRPFPIFAYFSDGKLATDTRLADPRDDANVAVDFRLLGTKDERASTVWVSRSDNDPLKDRIVWVVGDQGSLNQACRELARSRYMVHRYDQRGDSLTNEKRRLLQDEQTRSEDLEKKTTAAVAEAFMDGTAYFRGRELRPRDLGSSFATAMTALGNRVLPELYPHYSDIAVSETELAQLLAPQLAGPSTKFLESGLGILSLDAGKYVASCEGREPKRILQHIEDQKGLSGSHLLSHFGKPPFGYPADMVRACVAGLLRAGKIRIRPDQAPVVTSIKDPGACDLFSKDRFLRRADIFPAHDEGVPAHGRVKICAFFKDMLDLNLDRENDAIAEAVFQVFPTQRESLRDVESRLNRLPGPPPTPQALQRLGRAMEECVRSRQVEDIVKATWKNLDLLREGIQQLQMSRSELTDEAIATVSQADEVRQRHLAQIRAFGAAGEIETEAQKLDEELAQPRPWRAVGSLAAMADGIRSHYLQLRRALWSELGRQSDLAAARVKARDGFARLAADEAHAVLRPINDALGAGSPDAIYPTLVEVRDTFATRLRDAEERANLLLDELLSRQKTEKPVVKVESRIAGREIANEAQLKALLTEIEERVMVQLKTGARVRLV